MTDELSDYSYEITNLLIKKEYDILESMTIDLIENEDHSKAVMFLLTTKYHKDRFQNRDTLFDKTRENTHDWTYEELEWLDSLK